jgi:hypothetical protein
VDSARRFQPPPTLAGRRYQISAPKTQSQWSAYLCHKNLEIQDSKALRTPYLYRHQIYGPLPRLHAPILKFEAKNIPMSVL